MFEHFSNDSRNVITLAVDEASNYNSAVVGTDHILLGLLTLPNNTALEQIFSSFSINPNELKASLQETMVTYKESDNADSKSKFSVGTKDLLTSCIDDIIHLGKSLIEPEHLLLALTNSNDEKLVALFDEYGINHAGLQHYFIVNAEAEKSFNEEKQNSGQKFFSDTKADAKPRIATKESVLETYGDNLTQKALDGKLDPVIGRDKEVARLMQVLARRTKNNPVLVGAPGVGKTAIVEGLAQAILEPSTPKQLKGKIIYSLDLAAVVAGARYRGDFEERMKKIMKEVTERGNIIIFIDEIHTMIGAGSSEGGMDASNILKPMLARGEINTIGATTEEEFSKHFEKDAALVRRFQRIKVEEPSIEETILILEGLRDSYEEHHGVIITDEAIKVAASLSDRYIQDRHLPDKAIDLVDEAASRAKLNASSAPPEVVALNVEIAELVIAKKEAVAKEHFNKASTLREKQHALEDERDKVAKMWSDLESDSVPEVNEFSIADLLSESTGIPVFKITESEGGRLLRMERELHKRVIGQDQAVKVLSRTIRRQRTGLKDPNRPVGSFIFAGPTGVGKTELAKTLAEFLFSDEKALITIDMSEYAEKHSVSRLFGPPPGYVGYEDGGQLTEAVRRRPFSVILLDEIEKAHPSAFDPLLQVLEEGRLTDGQGRIVDFKNTVIIMTTNLGARSIMGEQAGFRFGDSSSLGEYERMSDKVNEALKEELRPEFLNRIDETVVFPHLEQPQLLQIVDIFLKNLEKRLSVEGYSLEVTDVARVQLCEIGYDKALGARPLRRAIQREIETPISEQLLFNANPRSRKLKVDFKKDAFTFNGMTYEKLQAAIEALVDME